jgi:hypothetical protein
MLISTAIGGIVLAGVCDLYVTTSHSMLGKTGAVEMQIQMKAAMDVMVREMQLMYGSPTITSGGVPVPSPNAGDTISFNRTRALGYSTGGNTNSGISPATLNDTRKAWAANAFAPSATSSYAVTITAGTGSGQILNISGNDATRLTLSGSWATSPDTTSLYLIYQNEGFTRTVANQLGYQRGNGGYTRIADNITALTFSQPDTASITIALTGRSSNPDPLTGQYNWYSLTDTVRRRN